MDDSDDFFQDSLILDEDDLALLAAEEEKYVQSTSKSTARASNSQPPAKRPKTTHRHDAEERPEIILQKDGTYGVTSEARGSSDSEIEPDARGSLEGVSQTQTKARIPQSNVLLNINNCQAPSVRQDQRAAAVRNSRTELRKPIPPRVAGPARPPTQNSRLSGGTNTRTTSKFSDEMTSTRIDAQAESRFQEEISALRVQVETLNRDHSQAKEALKEAEVARYAKEGEVSILRKRIAKAAQQHAADLAKLRETKEAADAEQVRTQKDMKEQMERLRTEYIFKQHELESSTRKSIGSSRSRRIAMGPQPSPVPIPPAMRNWVLSDATGPNRNNPFQETPSRRRTGLMENPVLEKSQKVSARTRPAVPELKFPGFENSFLQSSPVKSPSRVRYPSANSELPDLLTPRRGLKGKEKESVRERRTNGLFSPVRMPPLSLRESPGPVRDEPPADDSIQDFNVDAGIGDGSPRIQPKLTREGSSPSPDHGDSSSMVDLDLLGDPNSEALLEEDDFEGIDWSEELHFMLFSHMCKVSNMLTFHFLLSASIPTNQDYQRVCSSILEALGTKYKYATLEELLDRVANGLISMSVILWEAKYFGHLRALFDLLSSTMLYIPAFTSAILKPEDTPDRKTEPHTFLRVLCSIASGSLELKGHKDAEGRSSSMLVHSMLTLVETIAWTVPMHISFYLTPILQTDNVLMTLLDSRQSGDVISHTIRSLVLLATHTSLCSPLISVPDLDLHGQPVKASPPDISRVPLLESLCGFLVDAGRLNANTDDNISSILNFFSLLCVASPEGRTALLKSGMLVPCLVYYLTHLTTLIWEDDEHVMQSPDVAASIVQNIKQTLHLLHRLVFTSSNEDISEGHTTIDFDFRQKLYHAPHSLFNGLAHMFIVMIGRLSYADPPEWLVPELQTEIEKVTEPARDLMDTIIEGPEGDSVWAAYQGTENDSDPEDDEEARLLDDTE